MVWIYGMTCDGTGFHGIQGRRADLSWSRIRCLRHTRASRRARTVTSTRLRKVIAVAALLAAAPSVAACASGFDANTNKPYAPSEPNVLITDGGYGHNDIYIPQVFILGPDPGSTIPAGGRASLYLSVVNNAAQPDALIAVAPIGQQITSVEGAEPIAVPPNTLVDMGRPSP